MMKKLILCIVLPIIMVSCNKELLIEESFYDGSEILDPVKEDITTKAIPSPTFDWENADFIDCPECPTGKILLPWAYGSPKLGVPKNFENYNHPRNDGWILFYNTFGVGGAPAKFFALYNQLTGIMRVFYWYNGYGEGNQIFYGLKLNRPSIAFSGLKAEEPEPMLIVTGEAPWSNISSSAGLAWNNWYASEFQLYYDPIMKNYHNSHQKFELLYYKSTITDVQLSGTQIGTIEGSIEMQGTYTHSMESQTAKAKNKNASYKAQGADNMVSATTKSLENAKAKNPSAWDKLWQKTRSAVNAGPNDNVGHVVSKLINEGADIASNPIAYFFGSILGNNKDKRRVDDIALDGSINLTMNTKINLEGSLTTSLPIVRFDMKIPVTQGSYKGVGPTIEMENKELGVWSCSIEPEVNITNNIWFTNEPGTPVTTDDVYEEEEIHFKGFNILTNPNLVIIEKKIERLLYGHIPDMYVGYNHEFVSVDPETGVSIYRCNTDYSTFKKSIGAYVSPKYRVYIKLKNTIDNSIVTYSRIIEPKLNLSTVIHNSPTPDVQW